MARKPMSVVARSNASPVETKSLPPDFSLPAPLKDHPLVANKWYYTLPHAVWDRLSREMGTALQDHSTAKLETRLAQAADNISGCVGFRNAIPITDRKLRSLPQPDFTGTFAKMCFAEWKKLGIDGKAQLEQLFKPLEQAERAGGAFLGWLFTNQQFLIEFSELQFDFPRLFTAGNTPPQPVPRVDAAFRMAVGGSLRQSTDPMSSAVREFCERWRLNQIVGPRTLVPLAPQFGIPEEMVRKGQAHTSGLVINLPDTAQLPDRDTLRRLVEDAVRHTALSNEHLTEWTALAQSDTQGKFGITRYARWYKLQHYLRVLYSRHASVLERKQQQAERIIGEYLGLSADQLRLDLRDIRQRLGADWFRPTAG